MSPIDLAEKYLSQCHILGSAPALIDNAELAALCGFVIDTAIKMTTVMECYHQALQSHNILITTTGSDRRRFNTVLEHIRYVSTLDQTSAELEKIGK